MLQPPLNHAVDVWRALVRHALMTEEIESSRRRPVLVRRQTTAAPKMSVISDESRALYKHELTERAGLYMDAGLPEAEADARAVADLGCVEFWNYLQSTGGRCGPVDDAWAEEMERAA